MAENPVKKINDLYLQFCAGHIDRRQLLKGASALGATSMALAAFSKVNPASAQDASPVPLPGGYKSMTREEWQATQAQAFPFTKDVGAQKTGGTVVWGDIASANLTTTNIVFADNSPTQPVLFLVFETLTGTSPIDGQSVPGIADWWEIAEDGMTYTFHLSEKAMWHDGQPVTAHDFKVTFDAIGDDATGCSYTGTFKSSVASYREVDDHTFEVVASDVFAQIVFLSNIFSVVVPAHLWENIPHDQWKTDSGSTGADKSRVIGSGPFLFDAISEAEGTATFKANPKYWDIPSKPAFDTFIFQTWPDETAAIEALRSGDVDIYEAVPPSDIATLQSESSLKVAIYDTSSFRWYGYQLDPAKTTLFQELDVRKALYIALDRQSMVDNLALGYAVVPRGTQPTTSPAYSPESFEDYPFDPEQAKQLLDQAGWTVGSDGIREKEGQKLSFDVMYASGSAQLDQMAAYMQDAWKAVGVDAQPNPVDFDTVLVPALTESFDFRMVMLGFNWDASYDQSAMFSTENYGAGFNAMKYSNPEYDKLAAQANRELDPEKRKQLLIEASKIVWHDLPVGIIWFRQDATAYNARMHNYEPHSNATGGPLWSLPFVWVE